MAIYDHLKTLCLNCVGKSEFKNILVIYMQYFIHM